jgi:hypothetical protein
MLRTLIVLLTLAIAACATATPYQPASEGLGYSQQRLESNRFKVSFAGNSLTPRETVENYLLYRAAEVTLEGGFDWFLLVNQDTEKDTTYLQSFSGGFGSYSWRPYSFWSPGIAASTSMPQNEYQAQASILVFKGTKPEGEANAFDARDLQRNLEPSIVRPKPR